MPFPYAIHWFRRDLRIDGNPALDESRRLFQGRVLGLFCFDKKFLARPDFSVNRFQFFLKTLEALREDLKKGGGDLLCLDVGPQEGFQKVFSKASELPALVSWNRDYEPFARERDAKVEKWFLKKGVKTLHRRDHLLFEPHEIIKKSDPTKPFQIYTPFSKAWLDLFEGVDIAKPQKQPPFCMTWKSFGLDDVFKEYLESNEKNVTVPIPAAGHQEALQRLKAFAKPIEKYEQQRDIPSVRGTSGFSIYLKNGSLNISEIILGLGLKRARGSAKKFLLELVWREFYYYILYHFPHVEKESFNPKYKNIKWENREKFFTAWKEGMTGYPIVDAGMRQLKARGWMHNRVRMIVASFLTKDLLIDWRWGEQYFMEQLLDGDLAPNNGGWQWSASTGCDPQPYFRIFNPLLQSQKFDPDGVYIKKYIPELSDLNAKLIHVPGAVNGYPKPIVEHAEQKEKALALFKYV